MFWSKKKKVKKAPIVSTEEELAAKKAEYSRKIREQALENMRKARANIGDETLQKILKTMNASEKQRARIGKAQAKIQKADKDQLADHLLYMLKDKG